MDATQYGGSDFITTEIVKASKTKKLVIVGDGKAEDTDWGSRIEFPVEIDGRRKRYRPNKDTIKNCISLFGADTKGWLGKFIDVRVISVAGKDSVIGTPQK
jgi:hypothetical protein